MTTVMRTLGLVNPALSWLLGGLRGGDLAEVLAIVHRVLGILIIVIAGLIVLTAGPGRRSRGTAVLTALVLVAVVAVG
jgi:hypothetical protein